MSVTLKDVAKRAGVSVATAARVLGNYGSWSPDTRARVLQAAAELHYRPNAVARSMVKQKTRTLGLVIPDICNSFFTALCRGVEDVARRHGYGVVVASTDDVWDIERTALDELAQRRIDGFILASAAGSADALRRVLGKTPLVMVDRRVPDAPGDVVRVDNEMGAYRATQHLIALGHRRIGIVVGPAWIATTQERLAGYRRALEDAGVAFDPAFVQASDLQHRGQGVVDHFLRRTRPPTAIFTANNVVTTGVLVDLRRRGVRVPDQMAVVAFDDLDLAELLEPPLTAVSQPSYTMGTTAAELLLARLERGTPAAGTAWQEVVLQPSLIVRGSCGSRAAGPLDGGGRQDAAGKDGSRHAV